MSFEKILVFRVGMPLKVRIDAVDVERERMVLSLGDETLISEIKLKEKQTEPKKEVDFL